jgi:signal transduction histidine kinase/FixJ family two-component response regulator
MTDKPPHWSKVRERLTLLWLGRGSVAVIAVAAVAIVALMAGLIGAANRIDGLSARHDEQLVANGLLLKDGGLRACISPNTVWDDAIVHLDNRFDPAWADTNIGQYLTASCDVTLIYVLDATGGVLGAWSDGEPAAKTIPPAIRSAVDDLVSRVRAREASRGELSADPVQRAMIARAIDETTAVQTDPAPVVVSASLIQPDFGTALPQGSRSPVVITVQPLNAAYLDWLGSHFLLKNLHVQRDPLSPAGPGEASAVLRDHAGRPVARFDWQYRRPARDLAAVVAPSVGLLLLVLLGAPALTIWRDRRQTRRLNAAMAAANAASESKSRFIANMSHEIRTPMNGVMGVLHLLRRKPLDQDSRQLIEDALASGALLQGLLNDVLDLSRIESGSFELDRAPLDPQELLREVVGLFLGQAGTKGVELRASFSGEPELLLADGLRLRQVCLNLIGNAVKFTARGCIDVRCSLSDTATPGERLLRLEVEDTGIGIPASSQEQMFRRFSQADGSIRREFGGSGLGLSICAALVELMEGDIGFSSQEGVGSTFWVEIVLPVLAGVSVETLAKPLDAESDHVVGIRVLVVDDNPMNLKVARLLLEAVGAVVETAVNGSDGVEAAGLSHFDLILMDVQMPVMDGVAATKRIRLLEGGRGDVPIIGLTANVLPSQRQDYLAAGMDDVAEKPINPARLLEQIDAVRQRHEPAPVVRGASRTELSELTA